MKTNKYDSIIIGFGKGGKTLAFDLAKHHNQKVALIEQSDAMYGGTCINIGCIPTKRLVFESQRSDHSQESYAKAIQIKNDFIQKLRQKNYDKVASANVQIIHAQARFDSSHRVKITHPNGEEEILEAKKIFINTGSQAIVPPIIDALKDRELIYNSTELQNLEKLPQRLVIIGAGYIGCEFASIYRGFGSEVTLLDRSEQFLIREEELISQAIKENFITQGIELLSGVGIESITPNHQGVSIAITQNTQKKVIQADAVLYSTGRKPNIDDLDLEKAGIQRDPKGNIILNPHLQTSQSHIYVMGDATGNAQFTYLSLDDYRIIQSHLFENGQYTLQDRKNIPYSVFINPSFSRVGMTEKEALAKGFEIKTNLLQAAQIPKANVIKNPVGLLKVIVDQKTDLILGAHLFVEESYEIINLIKMAMDHQIRYTAIAHQIFTHPTISECLNDLFDF